jgi:pimeloyl-ACP methyl ester carboxylesterase
MGAAFSNEVLDVRGCRVTLKRGGAGPVLLYLHGAGGAAAVQPFMRELAASHTVLVPEHPGFGGSDEPGWLDNIHDLAYFYLDFLQQLDLRDVLLVGSSIGGWLALEMAVRSTARLRALSVIGPTGLLVPGLARGDIFLWTPEEKARNTFHDQKLAEQLLARAPTPEEAELAAKNHYTVAKLAWEPRMFDPHLHKWLHRVDVPVQVVWGAEDRILPAAYADEFKRLMPHARVDLIGACGHLPQTERPAEFLAALRGFSDGIAQGTRA